jgi:hypothetical protein
MQPRTLMFFLVSLLISSCSGPYVMEEVNVQDGVVVGEKEVDVGANGQITGESEEGYVPNDRYLDDYQDGGQNLGPNAPGYVP